MKTATLLCALFAGVISGIECARAGEKQEIVPVIEAPAEKDWAVILSLPMWAAGLDGDVGVRGYQPVGVDLPFYKIFENLEMTAAATVELRHRRWGLIFDGLYLKMGGSGDTPGGLISSVDVQLEQVLAEVALAWRVLEGEQGHLDLLAGARYVHLETELNFQLDSAGVQRVSNDLSDQILDSAVGKVQSGVDQAAARARARIDALPPVAGDARREAIRREVRSRTLEKAIEERALRDIIRTIRDLTPVEREIIRRKVEQSKEILAANRALARAMVEERVASSVGAAADKARARASRAVDKAKNQLSKAIEKTIRDAVPESVAQSKSWVDPFVGFRGRLYLTKSVYLSARGDVGGFAVGSDLAVNAVAAIGCQWSRRFSTDLGYRYLSMDYDKGGLKYDTAQAGFFLGVNYEF